MDDGLFDSARQKEITSKEDATSGEGKKERFFGIIAVRKGFIKEEELRRVLSIQSEYARKGMNKRLGEVCVELGMLTPQQVEEVLRVQERSILLCSNCNTPYLIEGFPPGKKWRCKMCGFLLEVPQPEEETFAYEKPPGPATARWEEKVVEEDEVSESKEFGNYEILEKVAQGGMGIIYKARQKGLDRIVALKVLLGGEAAAEEMIKRFYIEAKSIAKLRHPNIVPIHEVGVFEGKHFFTMDFIHGESLRSAILRQGRLPVPVALTIARKVADALHYAHEHNVVHRDIKPENILLDETGEPMITDFGLAKDIELEANVTRAGLIMGTPAYMAPEQARGERDRIGPLSDVYSVGSVLYEMLTGEPVYKFEGKIGLAKLLKTIQREITPPRRLNSSIPRDVETIVMKALEKEPERRYQSAKDLADDIERYMRGEVIMARPASLLYKTSKRLKKYWYIAVPTFAAIVFIVVMGVLFINQRIEEEQRRRQRIDTALMEAKGFFEEKEFDKALRKLEYVLSEDPKNIEAVELHSKCELLKEEAEKLKEQRRIRENAQRLALRAFESVREAERLLEEGNRWDAKMKLNEAIMNFSRALADFKELKEAKEGKFNACLKLGSLFFEDRAYGAAVLIYYGALGLGLDDEKVYAEIEKAKRAQQRMAEFDELILAAEKARADERWAEAIAKYEQALEFEALTPEERKEIESKIALTRYQSLYLEGKRLMKEGKFALAADIFKKAAAIRETDEIKEELRIIEYRTLISKARDAEREGRFLDAIEVYKKARNYANDPSDVEKSISLCVESAVKQLLKLTQEEFDRENYSKASEFAKTAALLKPGDPKITRLAQELDWASRCPKNMLPFFSGTYTVGSHILTDRNPVRKVSITFFYIDRYEVTNREFKKFVDAGGYEKKEFWDEEGWKLIDMFVDRTGRVGPATWENGTYPQGKEDFPVAGVSWFEASAFARWAGKRLPTEEEWEVAASFDRRLQKNLLYPWGDSWNIEAGNFDSTEPSPVGTHPLDRSPSGCFDMGGNLFEWTSSIYKEKYRVMKGGSFGLSEDTMSRFARNPKRKSPEPLYRSPNTGFRCAMTPKQ